MQYSSSVPPGSRQLNNHSSGALLANESAEAPPYDTLIGRKVWTRWPEDNSFYEAVIKDYDPVKVCLSLKKLPLLFFWTYFYLRLAFQHICLDVSNSYYCFASFLSLLTSPPAKRKKRGREKK